MSEWQLFEPGTVPECTQPTWYADRERAPHLEQSAHQERLHAAAGLIHNVVTAGTVATVSDLGAGDGGLLSLIDGVSAWGFDLMPSNVAGASERCVDVALRDIFTLDLLDFGDLSVCTEVLEHLIDPHAFVRSIPSRYLVASSPAYETANSHYEFHLWAWDLSGYRALLEQGGYTIIASASTSLYHVLLGERM